MRLSRPSRQSAPASTEWLNALELVGSFTVATSFPGAMIQLAWAMSDIETMASNIEANEREGKPKYKVLEYANRIERQLKSMRTC